ncbi:MAG: hypothetical protein EOP48_15670 [Sphingobacteriales bacterium]|nr:MAG: hypothetical protein EOP48_15670 [Sphingobacteriales bacterium]
MFIYALYSAGNDYFTYFYLDGRADSSKIYHFLTSLFTVVEYLIFAGIIRYLLIGRLRRIIILITSIGFTSFCIYEYVKSLETPSFDSMPASIEAILLIIFCMFFFFEQLTKPPTSVIYKSNRFWIAMGIMVYTSLSFFLFLQSSITPSQVFDSYWDINLVSNILKNIIFAIAFVIKDETPPNSGDKRLSEIKFSTTPSYKL